MGHKTVFIKGRRTLPENGIKKYFHNEEESNFSKK